MAKLLQQALGGIEGEIRVCLQYLFQAWNSRGPAKYRDMLLDVGTEEISHIEMLATAVALNLEGAPLSGAEAAIKQDGVVGAVLGGMNPRSFLSAGLGAMAFDAEGVPFSGAYVVGSGNILGDMYTNVAAESTGRVLATRLWELTDDPGMKDMLGFMIARDTMHQQQWLAVIEELGGTSALPIPNSFPKQEQYKEFEYAFISPNIDGSGTPSALELVDRHCLAAVDAWKGTDFAEEAAVLLLGRIDSVGAAGDLEAEQMVGCFEAGGATWAAASTDVQEAEALFTARRLAYSAVERLGPVLTEDVCVPIAALAEMLGRVEAAAVRHDVLIATVAHAGDGNVHPFIVTPAGDEAAGRRAHAAFEQLMVDALELGGTITGEHGIGLLKRAGLRAELPPAVLAMQHAVKAALDPHGLLNPGKVL